MPPPLAEMMKQMRIMIARTQDRFINTLFAERTIKTSLAPRWLLIAMAPAVGGSGEERSYPRASGE
jgi:hypothetical protein